MHMCEIPMSDARNPSPHNDPEETCDRFAQECRRSISMSRSQDPSDNEEDIQQMDVEEHYSDHDFEYVDLLIGGENAGIGSGDANC
jgi:hypothetical protein